MKIAFLENFLNIRGTSVALYDYAHYNETLLGNQSIVITRPFFKVKDFQDASIEVYQKFGDRFPVFFYEDNADIQTIVDRERVDALYVIKGGARDDGIDEVKNVKIFVHCVFHPHDPHGDCYAVISPWLNAVHNRHFPVLPHIVHLPETADDLRHELGIPPGSIVFGRHGGFEDFDHPDAQNAVRRIVAERHPIYFVFMNTRPFLPYSPNVIFLPKTTCTTYKTKFINTCDAMLYGRSRGETFGLAIGEFSSRNKPIFAALQAPDRMHHVVLQDRAYWFISEDDLYRKMVTFTKPSPEEDWHRYREYSPEKVMECFHEHMQNMLHPTTCYVTLFWDEPVRNVLDVPDKDRVVMLVHTRFSDSIPKVVAANVHVKVVEDDFLDRFELRKRKDRERAIVESPAFRQVVGSRVLGDVSAGHCKIEVLAWVVQYVSNATHFAWFGPNCTFVPSWSNPRTQKDTHCLNISVNSPLDPSQDGQVICNLQKGVTKIDTSFFTGSREAVLTYAEMYRKMHLQLLEKGIADDDRHLALLCLVENPALFRTHTNER